MLDDVLDCKQARDVVPSANGCDPKVQMAIIVEAVLGIVQKGAKRLLEMSQDEMSTMKRLFVELMSSPENARAEIVQAIAELAMPDETIGDLKYAVKRNPEILRRVKGGREYIGKQIRTYRESLGMTQAQLAKKAKIPQSHVSRLERGKLTPTRHTVERVAAALRVEPHVINPLLPELEAG